MTDVLRAAPGLTVEEVGDEICLLRPQDHEVLVLSTSAADVWRLIDGSTSVEEVSADLATAYAADPATVLADVQAVVEDLRARGFVVADDGSPAGQPRS